MKAYHKTRATREPRKRTPESYVLQAVLDLLAAERVFALRMNTGAIKTEGRFFRFGTPGCADVLAFPDGRVLWIECKSDKGRQSESQKAFQAQVEAEGHEYLLVRDVAEVVSAMRREDKR